MASTHRFSSTALSRIPHAANRSHNAVGSGCSDIVANYTSNPPHDTTKRKNSSN